MLSRRSVAGDDGNDAPPSDLFQRLKAAVLQAPSPECRVPKNYDEVLTMSNPPRGQEWRPKLMSFRHPRRFRVLKV
ncbi:PREDICTED: uncharacterized protein LOC109183710 isoform X2 [Ipomoea nil]|uniref:uncharacterized protein LOC109183710 isoform X2 n=1 Tax=Ipomoea nil TaxID=35883 RepID=UPI000901FE2A|nr:PREDICTED: uncharacterized protein LOC109183710 isoform X2 [Ipomoea nil]